MSMRPALLAVALLLAACARAPLADTPSNGASRAAEASASTRATKATPERASSSGVVHDAPSPSAAPTGIPGRTKPAPPMSAPLPPEVAPSSSASPSRPDTRCRTDADCTVKDVGSCCGAMPACVSRDAAVDPAAVKADCARRGIASTCGFKEIQGCACVAGTCQDASDAAGVAR